MVLLWRMGQVEAMSARKMRHHVTTHKQRLEAVKHMPVRIGASDLDKQAFTDGIRGRRAKGICGRIY